MSKSVTISSAQKILRWKIILPPAGPHHWAGQWKPASQCRQKWLTDWLLEVAAWKKNKKAFFLRGGEEKKPNLWFDVPNKKLGFASPTGFRTSHSRSTIETKLWAKATVCWKPREWGWSTSFISSSPANSFTNLPNAFSELTTKTNPMFDFISP